MDAEQTSQVLQRLQLLEQAATEQLIARRNAEHSLVEAQTSVGAIDQELSTDMTHAESSTDALSNEAMTGQKKARSVQLVVLGLDHVMHGKIPGSHCKCSAAGAWRRGFSFKRILQRTMQDLL